MTDAPNTTEDRLIAKRDPRLSNVILALTEVSYDKTPTMGDLAEAALKAADEASYRCTICGAIVSYHDVLVKKNATDVI